MLVFTFVKARVVYNYFRTSYLERRNMPPAEWMQPRLLGVGLLLLALAFLAISDGGWRPKW